MVKYTGKPKVEWNENLKLDFTSTFDPEMEKGA